MWAKHWALFGALSWVVSMTCVGWLVWHMNEQAEDARRMSLRATATLVGFSESDDRDGSDHPTVRRFEVYEFRSDTGQRVRFSSPILGADAPRQLGANVPIRYPAYAPQAAKLVEDGLARTTRMALWVVPAGMMFAVPFLIIWIRSRGRSAVELDGG